MDTARAIWIGAAATIAAAFITAVGSVATPLVQDWWKDSKDKSKSGETGVAGSTATLPTNIPAGGRQPPVKEVVVRTEPKPCSSPWPSLCATATCPSVIQAHERLQMHLSSVHRDATPDPCRESPVPDLWVCRGDTCLSQREACMNQRPGVGASSSTGFEVTGRQLVYGFSLQVREGGPTEPVIAELRPAYGDALGRAGFACLGGTYKGAKLGPDAGPIVKLSYYLEAL